MKYERAVREADFTKKKHQQEFEDKLETEQQSRRHAERKVRTRTRVSATMPALTPTPPASPTRSWQTCGRTATRPSAPCSSSRRRCSV